MQEVWKPFFVAEDGEASQILVNVKEDWMKREEFFWNSKWKWRKWIRGHNLRISDGLAHASEEKEEKLPRENAQRCGTTNAASK